jgi:hypothetical protein
MFDQGHIDSLQDPRYTENNKHLLNHINVHAKRNEVAIMITNERNLYRKSSIYKKAYNPESGDFTCKICSKKYLYRQSLQVHIKEHQPNRVFRFNCELCIFNTDHKGHFTRHIKSHSF